MLLIFSSNSSRDTSYKRRQKERAQGKQDNPKRKERNEECKRKTTERKKG
jgi:hypothetical protein